MADGIHVLADSIQDLVSKRVIWTDELESSFKAAKELAANPVGITEPRPDDQLRTFSDYSAEKRAVGGRLTIIRTRGG